MAWPSPAGLGQPPPSSPAPSTLNQPGEAERRRELGHRGQSPQQQQDSGGDLGATRLLWGGTVLSAGPSPCAGLNAQAQCHCCHMAQSLVIGPLTPNPVSTWCGHGWEEGEPARVGPSPQGCREWRTTPGSVLTRLPGFHSALLLLGREPAGREAAPRGPAGWQGMGGFHRRHLCPAAQDSQTRLGSDRRVVSPLFKQTSLQYFRQAASSVWPPFLCPVPRVCVHACKHLHT